MARDTGDRDMDARAVFAAAVRGEEWAIKLRTTSERALAELCANLVTMLGVTRIAIGGSVGLSSGYVGQVQNELKTLPESFQAEVVAAELRRDGPLLGSLLAITDCQ
jgi:N-acylmannosamine kinase